MKFAINKNVLLENLNNVVRGISTKNVIPILNGIKFELTNDGLTLMASDSELTIETFISKDDILEINNTGTIIISSKYILDIIRKMPSEVINFEMQDSLKIRIYSDFNQYDLNALDPNDYPSIKLISHKDPIVIKASILKELINQTSFAISTQELRPILTGLNIKINGDYLECIATDSYRLAKKNIKLDSPTLLNVDLSPLSCRGSSCFCRLFVVSCAFASVELISSDVLLTVKFVVLFVVWFTVCCGIVLTVTMYVASATIIHRKIIIKISFLSIFFTIFLF